MLPPEQDSYNRAITKQELQSSYKIFKELLKPECKNKNLKKQILSQDLEKNDLHKVILLDCRRTRSTNFDDKQKEELRYFLGYFVLTHQIQYKQGLNEIAAPFIYWTKIGVDLGECYEMFEKFFIKFSLNFYYDKNFTGVEMFFRMISIVLRYHCPSLSRYLQVYDIEPQLYALSWLMTLFSSKLSLQMTYLLWSYLIAQNDRYFLFFIVVGIIVRRQNIIIQTQNSSVFKIVTDMIFKGEQQLEQVLKISLILRNNTPFSLTTFFEQKQIFDRMESYKDSAQLLQHINRLNLFLVLPKQLYYSNTHHPTEECFKPSCILCRHNKTINLDRQIVQDSFLKNLIQISNDIKKIKNSIDYVILDLRKQQTKLNLSSLIHSIHIEQPFQQIESQFLNLFIESKYAKHFIILLTGFTFEDITFSDQDEFKCATKLLQVLNSYSFSYLGILQGGYTALSIFEQEFRIKKQLQISSNIHKKVQNEQRNSKDSQQQNQNLTFLTEKQLSLSLSVLFQIASLKFSNNLKFYHGQQKTLTLVTQMYVIIIEDIKGFSFFMSFLQHNCSIIPYLLSNLKTIQCKILKIIPISKITEIKTKQKNQNILVLLYKNDKQPIRPTIKINSNQNSNLSDNSFTILEEFKTIMKKKYLEIDSNSDQNIKKQNQNINTTAIDIKKITITMKNQEIVKKVSSAITKSYKNQLRKKLQNTFKK